MALNKVYFEKHKISKADLTVKIETKAQENISFLSYSKWH